MGGVGGSARPHSIPACLPGFEHIKRYWAQEFARPVAYILPGEYYVSAQDEVIGTVLGSCVSACIRDTVLGMGGMNHFMLPSSSSDTDGWKGTQVSMEARYGGFAMELLINEIMKNGGKKNNLEIKIFGGGKVLRQLSDIGRKNIDFVRHYISSEHLRLVAEDVGDIYPRKIYYFPATGVVKVKKLKTIDQDPVVAREQAYLDKLTKNQDDAQVELF